MALSSPEQSSSDGLKMLKYSQHLRSSTVSITISKSHTFHLHSNLLTSESERFSRSLNGGFKEAEEKTIDLSDEDPDLFGFFIEWLYRDRSIISRAVENYSHYVTLARLYALGERLLAPNFQSQCLWRFTESLTSSSSISDESTCELLRVAGTEITERLREDPMRAQIFWYGSKRITNLQKFDMFHQLLRDIPDLGNQLCLWMGRSQPERSAEPTHVLYNRFAPESEYSSEKQAQSSTE